MEEVTLELVTVEVLTGMGIGVLIFCLMLILIFWNNKSNKR